jgi:co-chaperonin GroES (HSP10)
MKIPSIDTFCPKNNWVLVKPDEGNHKVILKSGVVLFLDTSFEKEKHSVCTGKVVKVPEKIIFNERFISVDFDTEQELETGDKIIFHYLQSLDNIRESRYIECDGVVYFLVKYDSIFCALRNSKVIPVNGLVIVEPDDEEIKTIFIVPDSAKKKSTTTGTIRYIGSPLKGYKDYPDYADVDELAVGDKVVFDKHNTVPLQYPLHQTIDKDKVLYKMRRIDIAARIDEEVAA